MKLNTEYKQTMQKVKKIPPKLCFEILSAEITNKSVKNKTIKKPFNAQNIRFIGLKLKIKSKGNQKVNIYLKYVDPLGEYRIEYSDHPGGFIYHYNTEPVIETITPETKIIDISGWGNNEWCSYMVGKHKIEVYIEGVKVFTKTFKVDWSPHKKAKLIKQLEILQTQRAEIKKFKWGRFPKTRRKDVRHIEYEIRSIIDRLRNKTGMNCQSKFRF